MGTIGDDDFDVLINDAVNGKPEAVEGVLRRIRPLVVRYCRARVGGRENTFASADDVAQEVCFAVLRALPSYRDQGRPFLAFVYGIASHKVADAHRSSARNRSELAPEVREVPDLGGGAEHRTMLGEFVERMTKLMETLPERQREIVRLRVMVGLSAEETAEAVGSTTGAVRVAQGRALRRLRIVSQQSAENAQTAAEDVDELDYLLADADISFADNALREALSAPVVTSPNVYGVHSTDDDYIDQLLHVADSHLRQRLDVGNAELFGRQGPDPDEILPQYPASPLWSACSSHPQASRD